MSDDILSGEARQHMENLSVHRDQPKNGQAKLSARAFDLLNKQLDRDDRALLAGITDEVVKKRGYWSMHRSYEGDLDSAARLKALGISAFYTSSPKQHRGIVMPSFGPGGQHVGTVYRMAEPATDYSGRVLPDGTRRKIRYLQSGIHVDVHPFNTERVQDPGEELWVTEGIKKADALTSQGLCVAAMFGVFNWKSKHGVLGDWEEVPLKGRRVVVCFDSDALTNRDVYFAMKRFGRWLRSRGAKVLYLITPDEVDVQGARVVREVKGDKGNGWGADDYLAAGGTLDGLREACSASMPKLPGEVDAFTDAYMAATVAGDALYGRFCWTRGMGWMEWTGQVWSRCDESATVEAVRLYVIEQNEDALRRHRDSPRDSGAADDAAGWNKYLSGGKIRTVTGMARGIVTVSDDALDADPHLLNCHNGVVDLRTGELSESDPDQYMTRVCGVDYDPAAECKDWDAVLTAVPDGVRPWLRAVVGQAASGLRTERDHVPFLCGNGSNAKSTLMAAVSRALGSYYVLVPDSLLTGKAQRDESMTLRGARFALIEETAQGAYLNAAVLKKVTSPDMSGHHLYASETTWKASHTLFVTTNHRPIVTDTDDGIWRRLPLVTFPYRYVRDPRPGTNDRKGDPTLRPKIEAGDPEILRAALAWIVAGAREWYDAGMVLPELPEQVEADSRAWRMETDLILGLWSGLLVADTSRYVMSTDLFRAFTDRLRAQGHPKTWTDRAFTPQFAEHSETTANHVVKHNRVKASRPGISRYTPADYGAPAAPPGEFAAWIGVRFREDAEEAGGNPFRAR